MRFQEATEAPRLRENRKEKREEDTAGTVSIVE
jgi:hypothetical protein